MWLDLRKILETPGASEPFAVTLDPEQLAGGAVSGFRRPPEARGEVVNTAGLLNLRGELTAEMVCVCDRCGTVFDRKKVLPLDVPLAADVSDEASPEVFAVEGDGVDVSEIAETCFLLNLETKCLCRPDCQGLCPRCGKNLNEGPCACAAPADPRLAVLARLLEDPQEEEKE